MRTYWSIQDEIALEKALKNGYLEGSEEHICIPEFLDSYNWMKTQMIKRIPNYNGEQPIWLWLNKPDMRAIGHAPKGSKIVRLEIELPEDNVLISDFDSWHNVLNETFNADNEKEWEDYYNGKAKESLEGSWERIFELKRERDENWCGKREDVVYQGTTGRVNLTQIKRVENFIAR